MAEKVETDATNVKLVGQIKTEPISENDDSLNGEPGPKSSKRQKSEETVPIKTEPEGTKDINICETDSEIKITVKTTKEKHVVSVDKEATMKQLKEKVAKVLKTPTEQLCLIYSGKVLNDNDTLSDCSIEEGHTVHVIIKVPTPPAAPNISASPFGLGMFGGIPGLGTLGLGSPNFVEVQQQMQRELLRNPELLQQVMTNPFVQSMMENPEYMRQIVTSNPQMQEMLQGNPELSQMLYNPDVLHNTMEIARNPAMLQELIRSRVEVASGNASSEEKANETAAPSHQKSAPNSVVTINSDSPSSSERSTQEDNLSAASPTAGSENAQTQTPLSGGGTLFTSPGLQSIMQQMVQNPQLVHEMFSAPYMHSMMDALAANPEVASQIMVNNPIFGNNPQLQQQLRQTLPMFIQQMQNPELQSFMSNPQALTAMMNIHQGLDTLQQAAPTVFNMFPGQPPSSLLHTAATAAAQASKPSQADDAKKESGADPKGVSQDTFNHFMKNMVNAMAQGTNPQLPPEERYRNQLHQMQVMGFSNKEANIQALIATFGDVNSAIERLLSQVP